MLSLKKKTEVNAIFLNVVKFIYSYTFVSSFTTNILRRFCGLSQKKYNEVITLLYRENIYIFIRNLLTMKKLHLSLKNEIASIKEFTEAEYQEIETILNRLILNSKMKWAFEVINRNYRALHESTFVEFANLSTGDLMYENLELATLEINRHILNYLASLNTFIDQTKKFLSKRFGKPSPEFSSFEAQTNILFDTHFSYRFLQKLRNFTVHCGFSLCGIEIEGNHKKISFIPKFIYEDLMEDPSFWGTKVRPDLEEIGGDFPAFILFQESLGHFQHLSDFVITEFLAAEELTFAHRFYELTGIEHSDIDEYCFLVQEDEMTKVAQIPTHYLRIPV